MRKAMILLTAILVAGGDIQAQSQALSTHDYRRVREVCIDGVIYLVFGEGSRGGITPKINADFYPYTCLTKEEKYND